MGDVLIDLTDDASPELAFPSGSTYKKGSIPTALVAYPGQRTYEAIAQQPDIKSSEDVLDELIREENLKQGERKCRRARRNDRSPTPPARRAVRRQEAGRQFVNNIISCTNPHDPNCPFSRMLRDSEIQRRWHAEFPDDPLTSPSTSVQTIYSSPAPEQTGRHYRKARRSQDRNEWYSLNLPAHVQGKYELENMTRFVQQRSRSRSHRRTRNQAIDEQAPIVSMQPLGRLGHFSHAAVAQSFLDSPNALKTWLCELQSLQLGNEGKPPRGAGVIAFRCAALAPELCAPLQVCLVEKAPRWRCSKCGTYMYDTWFYCIGCHEPRPESIARCVPGGAAGGVLGFPKGGKELVDQGCILANALREWQEETGIPPNRLRVIPNRHFDDPGMGVRFLLAICTPSGDSLDSLGQLNSPTRWRSPEVTGLQCSNNHLLNAQRASATGASCQRCNGWIGVNNIYLSCGACNFSVCSKCQDLDPIFVVHWMQVDHARKLLNPLQCALLDNAIGALRALPRNIFT